MTSQYPSEHKVGFSTANRKLPALAPTLAEVLQQHGYTTAAMVVGVYLNPYFGFARGFDSYQHVRRSWTNMSDARALTTQALDWLAEHGSERWLLWLHYFDAHEPYIPPDPYANLFDPDYNDVHNLARILYFDEAIMQQFSFRDIEHVQALYDGAIRYVDEHIGRLLDYLQAHDILKKTIVIITSDHGESFHRGMIGHGGLKGTAEGPTLFDELIHIPLIVKYPQANGRRLAISAQLVDVMPTLLGMLGLPPPEEISGIDLLATKENILRPIFSEQPGFSAVRLGDFKLVQSHKPETPAQLYNLRQDPGESTHLDPADFPSITDKLLQAFHEHQDSVQKKRERFSVIREANQEPHYPMSRVRSIAPERLTTQFSSTDPDILNSKGWDTDGQWKRKAEDRVGVIRFAPWKLSGSLKQRIHLLPDRPYAFVLEFKRHNSVHTVCQGSSVAFKIIVEDHDSQSQQTVFQDRLDSQEQWRQIVLDFSAFAGIELTAQLAWEIGGPYGISCRGPLLVDKFYIAQYQRLSNEEIPEDLRDEIKAFGYIQ